MKLKRWKLWKRRQLAEEEEGVDGTTLKQKLLGADACTEDAERYGSRTPVNGTLARRPSATDDVWNISTDFNVDNLRGVESELRDSSPDRQEDGIVSNKNSFTKRGSSSYLLQASDDSATERVEEKNTNSKKGVRKEREYVTPVDSVGEKERGKSGESVDTSAFKDPTDAIRDPGHFGIREESNHNEPFEESRETPSGQVEERPPSRFGRRRSGPRQSGRVIYHDHDLLIADDAIEIAAMDDEMKRITRRASLASNQDMGDLTQESKSSQLALEAKRRQSSALKTEEVDSAVGVEQVPPAPRFARLRRAYSDRDLWSSTSHAVILANDSLLEDIMSLDAAEREWLKEYILSRKNRSELGSEERVPPGFRLPQQRQVLSDRALIAAKDEDPDVAQMKSMLSSQSSIGSTIESNSIRDEKLPDFKGVILAGNMVLPDGDETEKTNSYLSSETEEEDNGFSSGSFSDGTSQSLSTASNTSEEIGRSGSESCSSFEEDVGILESAQHVIGRLVQCKGL